MTITHYVGLDVHKDTIAIAYAHANTRTDPVFIGTTEFSPGKVKKAVSKLASPASIRICFEAGPCGYGLAGELIFFGFDCEVIAPSRVARQPSDKIKTDRKDALLLARLHRAGELTPVVIPYTHDETIRDLVRTREDAVVARRRARQQIAAFLLRQGKRYTEGEAWTKRYQLYLSRLKLEDDILHTVFTESRMALLAADERLLRAEQALRNHVLEWRCYPVIQALMTMRGIDFWSRRRWLRNSGTTGVFHRLLPLCRLWDWFLLSTQVAQDSGAINKSGNRYVRRMLLEAAWNYRFPTWLGEAL